jgi:hypothetical protein
MFNQSPETYMSLSRLEIEEFYTEAKRLKIIK